MLGDKKLLLANKAWARSKQNFKEDYFENVDKVQKPDFLWIGSSDSRVPAEEITGVQPGELLVHRNVGNLVQHSDLNILGVLKYAIEVHNVNHIIVCGHYGCAGTAAAYSSNDYGILNKWLYPIKNIQKANRELIESQSTKEEKINKLIELVVIEQTHRLSHTSIVQKNWKLNNKPHLHGWIYNPKTGLLSELIHIEPRSEIDPIYTYDIDTNEEV